MRSTKRWKDKWKRWCVLVVVVDEVVEMRRVHLAQRQVDMRPHHRRGRHIVRVWHVHERFEGHREVPQRRFGDGGHTGWADRQPGLADATGVCPGQRWPLATHSSLCATQKHEPRSDSENISRLLLHRDVQPQPVAGLIAPHPQLSARDGSPDERVRIDGKDPALDLRDGLHLRHPWRQRAVSDTQQSNNPLIVGSCGCTKEGHCCAHLWRRSRPYDSSRPVAMRNAFRSRLHPANRGRVETMGMGTHAAVVGGDGRVAFHQRDIPRHPAPQLRGVRVFLRESGFPADHRLREFVHADVDQHTHTCERKSE